jgi:signal transduction histidine kinase
MNFTFGIIIFSQIENFEIYVIAILLVFVILFLTTLWLLIDVVRRKYTVDKQIEEIRDATEKMTFGDFNIKLIPAKNYNNYNYYDLIKIDLNTLAKELSKNEMLKTDFISNVSHEIKTPLAVIKSYAKALENDKLDNETKNKYLNSLQEACNNLNNLITNILKLNKLENQELNLEYKKYNLSESIVSHILQFESLIDKKNINLICDIEEDIIINSEEDYLGLIWNNLISNAIKFTNDHGTITIKLKKEAQNIEFEISDTGCGMDNEVGSHIFEKFYQADTSHSKEGNGLGLPLVKRVIDVLGGNISVVSELNVGTTFKVTLKEK